MARVVGQGDLAGLPLLALAAGAVSLFLVPVATRCRARTSAGPTVMRWR